MKKSKKNQSFRRKFFKTLLTGGIGAVAGKELLSSFPSKSEDDSDEQIKALTSDGKLIKVL
ncbi:MAG: hypothetical protein KAR17_05705, partial [Cyclobacteriaceae bacterium]|nr:hypothetical protein [Cyclobacteriaceae bacterium]